MCDRGNPPALKARNIPALGAVMASPDDEGPAGGAAGAMAEAVGATLASAEAGEGLGLLQPLERSPIAVVRASARLHRSVKIRIMRGPSLLRLARSAPPNKLANYFDRAQAIRPHEERVAIDAQAGHRDPCGQ